MQTSCNLSKLYILNILMNSCHIKKNQTDNRRNLIGKITGSTVSCTRQARKNVLSILISTLSLKFLRHGLTAKESLDMELIKQSSLILAVVTMSKSTVIPGISGGVKSSISQYSARATGSQDLATFSEL